MTTLSAAPGLRSRTKAPHASRRGPVEVIALGQRFRIPAEAWTLDGFRHWATSADFPERGRISFIDGGIIVDMSPEEFVNHSLLKPEVGRVVGNVNSHKQRGLLFGDRTLVTNKDANLSTEPDSGLVTWESLESGRVRLVPRRGDPDEYVELQGSPDWLLEIVSKYSVKKDTKVLFEKYHDAKVSEYWLIDARGKNIKFTIFIYKPQGYEPAPIKNSWQYSPVFGCWFRLERKKNRVGLWQYTLHVKP